MCGAAPASVRKTAAPFSHARVLDIRPSAGGREGAGILPPGGRAAREREREREPSSAFPPVFIVLLLIGTFRPSLARTVLCETLTQSVSQSIFSLAFSASNFTSRYGVSEGALPSPRLPSFLPCSLGGVSSFFSSPKNLLKTFSLQAGGGPLLLPPLSALSFLPSFTLPRAAFALFPPSSSAASHKLGLFHLSWMDG